MRRSDYTTMRSVSGVREQALRGMKFGLVVWVSLIVVVVGFHFAFENVGWPDFMVVSGIGLLFTVLFGAGQTHQARRATAVLGTLQDHHVEPGTPVEFLGWAQIPGEFALFALWSNDVWLVGTNSEVVQQTDGPAVHRVSSGGHELVMALPWHQAHRARWVATSLGDRLELRHTGGMVGLLPVGADSEARLRAAVDARI